MRRDRKLPIALMASVGLAFLATGCGKPVLRMADASLGDYYTEKEYKKLREEQRQEYCEELANQDSIYREEIAEAREAAEQDASRSAEARAAVAELSRVADSLEAVVAVAMSKPRGRETSHAQPETSGERRTVTVRAGDSLWRLSAGGSIYGDGRRWNELYEANRDRIRDADRIYPGQELVIPR